MGEYYVYQGERLNVHFHPHFLSDKEAKLLFKYIEERVPWSNEITENKRVNQNYGDKDISYKLTFGGYQDRPVQVIERKVKEWKELPILETIKEKLSIITETKYNYCVIQRYPNGKIGIKPHKDREMLPGTIISGISLGATRILTLTPPKYNKIDKSEIHIGLVPGSLYVLMPPTNDHWSHSIEKDFSIKEPRISLTFRQQ